MKQLVLVVSVVHVAHNQTFGGRVVHTLTVYGFQVGVIVSHQLNYIKSQLVVIVFRLYVQDCVLNSTQDVQVPHV